MPDRSLRRYSLGWPILLGYTACYSSIRFTSRRRCQIHMMRAISLVVLSFLVINVQTANAESPWIIDPHTHFKGEEQIRLESQTTQRAPNNTLGQVVKPEDYRALADRLGIQSTLVVEAVDQETPQFNEWLLDQAKSELICGYVARGNLASEDFANRHEAYRKTGLLNGYRFRMNELSGYLDDDTARGNLASIQRQGLVIDLLVDPSHADDIVRLATEFPGLKIVINHCFRAQLIEGKPSDAWIAAVKKCSAFPNIHMKISSIVNFAGTKPFVEQAPTDLETYLPILDVCFDAFGEDRVIFATNWGVCTHWAPVDDVVRIVKEFLSTKGDAALRKGMRENAIRVYGIHPKWLRDTDHSQQ